MHTKYSRFAHGFKNFHFTESGWTFHTRAALQLVHNKLHNAFALINDPSSKHVIIDT